MSTVDLSCGTMHRKNILKIINHIECFFNKQLSAIVYCII